MKYAVIVLLALTGACAGTQTRAQTAADSVAYAATAVESGYAAAEALCDVREGAIVDKAQTFEQGREDLDKLRERCDKAFASFESAQVVVNRAIRAQHRYQDGEISAQEWQAFAVDAFAAAMEVATIIRELRSGTNGGS